MSEKWTAVVLDDVAWGEQWGWPDFLSVSLKGGDTEWRKYVPERTCHDISECEHSFRCSVCGATDLDFTKPTYCHGCGARVVST